MDNPIVSVVIPVYNSEKYVGEAIQSLLDQTFKEFEIIIIDDCSKDNSINVIEQYKDPRIRFIKSEKNKGFLNELNYGFSLAKGRYIARLDDDDISYPERLAKQVEYMDKHEEIALLGTHMDLLVNNEKVETKLSPIQGPAEVKFSLLFGNYCIGHSTFMIRKSFWEEYKLQYETFLQTPDHHMQLTICKYGNVDYIREALVAWRIHPEQSTQVRKMEMKTEEEDRTRCLYIDSLPFELGKKEVLKKAVRRMLRTEEEFQLFEKTIVEYAKYCGIESNTVLNNKCCQLIYSDIMLQQQHNRILLKNYAASKLKNKNHLYSRSGLRFLKRCLMNDNKNWIPPIGDKE